MERDGGRLSRVLRFYTLVEEEKSRLAVTQRASAADKLRARGWFQPTFLQLALTYVEKRASCFLYVNTI